MALTVKERAARRKALLTNQITARLAKEARASRLSAARDAVVEAAKEWSKGPEDNETTAFALLRAVAYLREAEHGA